jgi:hypothetical protein
METDPAAVAEERRRLRTLRTLVDLTANVIAQSAPTRAEAEALVAETRQRALELFPEKAETFDLILAPRFARLIAEFARDRGRARLLPFRRQGRTRDSSGR